MGVDLSNWAEQGEFDLTLNYDRGKSYSTLTIFPAQTVLPIGSDGNIDFINPAGFTRFEQGLIGTPNNFQVSKHVKLTRLMQLATHKVRWEAGYTHHVFSTSEFKNFGLGILNHTFRTFY